MPPSVVSCSETTQIAIERALCALKGIESVRSLQFEFAGYIVPLLAMLSSGGTDNGNLAGHGGAADNRHRKAIASAAARTVTSSATARSDSRTLRVRAGACCPI